MKTIQLKVNVVATPWDEMVFKGRNKAYGAYVLRKDYMLNCLRGLIFGGISVFLLLGCVMLVSFIWKPKVADNKPLETIITIVKPPEYETKSKVKQPKMIAGIKINKPPPPKNLEFKVVRDKDIPEPKPQTKPEPPQDLQNQVAPIREGDPNGDPMGDPKGSLEGSVGGKGDANGTEETKEPSFTDLFLGKEPVPKNMREFRNKLVYPFLAKEIHLEGKVVVRVLVDTNGKYLKHVVLRNPHPLFTKEVAEKLKYLEFTPGLASNQLKVKVWVTLPVDFKLK